MKSLLNLLIISTIATSCINLNGQLNVQQNMSVKKRGGFLNLGKRTVTLKPGIYQTDLKVNGANSFVLKLSLNNDVISIPLKSKSSLNLPETGDVEISGDDISQPFDLNGTIKTDYSDSSTTRTEEKCTITRTENHCEKICNNPPHQEGRPVVICNIVCHDVAVTFTGIQIVDFHTHYTSRELNLVFRDTNSAAGLATFKANGTESERVNDYIGECR